MWGMIAKITLLPGKRDEMVGILKDSAADMPGCLSYVVAKDAADENTIWVTEVWESMTSHDASLSLPVVKNAIPRGKAIVSNFERVAVTSPVWGRSVIFAIIPHIQLASCEPARTSVKRHRHRGTLKMSVGPFASVKYIGRDRGMKCPCEWMVGNWEVGFWFARHPGPI